MTSNSINLATPIDGATSVSGATTLPAGNSGPVGAPPPSPQTNQTKHNSQTPQKHAAGYTSLVPDSLVSLFDASHRTVTSFMSGNPSLPVSEAVKLVYGRSGYEGRAAGNEHEGGSDWVHEGNLTNADEQALGGFGGSKSDASTVHAESGGAKGKLHKLMDKLKFGTSADNAIAHSAQGSLATKHEEKHKEEHKKKETKIPQMRHPTAEELQRVSNIGRWEGGDQPGELFLQILTYAIQPLKDHPLAGLVSPPLMASSGVIPLTILSVIPDIIEHHADLITRAESEIFLATNFWEASGAAKTICDAFRELSRRVVEDNRPKVVVKMMYDRGNPKQVIKPHQLVEEKEYTGAKVKLPTPEEIPGISLEVVNFHEPPVGTFHAKYMVVDRKVALINSNNIQDRVNVEFMVHVEGPIVQGFYDMALLSWDLAFHPPLPLLRPDFHPSAGNYAFGQDHPILREKNLGAAQSRSKQTLHEQHRLTETAGMEEDNGSSQSPEGTTFDKDDATEAKRVNSNLTTDEEISRHLNTGTKIPATSHMTNDTLEFRPLMLHDPHNPFPIALVNRCPHGRPGHSDTFVPQDQAWLAGFRFAKHRVLIQTPTFNAKPVVQAAIEAVRRGIVVDILADLGFNDEGELLPYQGGTNAMVAMHMYSVLSTPEEKDRLRIYWYTGKDQDRPLNAKDKSRNCHVKLMIIDDEIAVQGNGNQDSQSWFHSQEINILFQSSRICRDWIEAMHANQNTFQRGLVGKDGIWRDPEGNRLKLQEDPKAPKGPLKSLAGVKGAIQRVRGEGGF